MTAIRAPSKEIRDLIIWASDQGWSVRRTGSGHCRFDHPRVRHPVFTPATPRTGGMKKERAKLNTALRRATEGQHA